jgi:pimeloyl-ACP methyl ester carboxylesterase
MNSEQTTKVALVLALIAACDGQRAGESRVDAANPASCGARESMPISLDTGTGVLAGTLEIPAGCGPFPVGIIHAGSGPTDRDGNSDVLPGPNDSLRMLALGLAERGVASLRYDKRGIAASAAAGPTSERDFRFQTYVDDLAHAVNVMAGDRRFRRVVLIGHSEGALIATLAAGGNPAVAALASVAGPGRPAGIVLREQLAAQISGSLLERANQIIAELEAGRQVANVPPSLASVFRPSVQPYLIEWFSHDPARALAGFPRPALIVHGTTDLQVSLTDAQTLAAAKPDARLVIIEGMNHVLKAVSGDSQAQLPSYSDPALPVVPALIEAVAELALAAR